MFSTQNDQHTKKTFIVESFVPFKGKHHLINHVKIEYSVFEIFIIISRLKEESRQTEEKRIFAQQKLREPLWPRNSGFC